MLLDTFNKQIPYVTSLRNLYLESYARLPLTFVPVWPGFSWFSSEKFNYIHLTSFIFALFVFPVILFSFSALFFSSERGATRPEVNLQFPNFLLLKRPRRLSFISPLLAVFSSYFSFAAKVQSFHRESLLHVNLERSSFCRWHCKFAEKCVFVGNLFCLESRRKMFRKFY